jgi:nitrate reductase gamma subunit
MVANGAVKRNTRDAAALGGRFDHLVADASIVFKLHLTIGLTIFLLFPFTRLMHIWSGFASVFYLFRPYQLVRSRGGNR